MNKQEIQHRIKRYELVRECAEENLNELKTQLAEVEKLEKLDKFLEKPKLRHGDFGITTRESIDKYDKFLIRKTFKGELEPEYQDGLTDGSRYAEKNLSEYIIFGNVFDLMKGWDKPFRTAFVNDVLLEYSSRFDKDIFINSNHQHLTLTEAEEIHSELGHAIAELKQKKDREC